VLLCVPCGKKKLRDLTANILFFMELHALHGKKSPYLRPSVFICGRKIKNTLIGFDYDNDGDNELRS
jgi:hypothetical protein